MAKKIVRRGTQGWEILQRTKFEILHPYDDARRKSRHQPVQTDHGNVAEAEFRRFLQDFLPKRYGVTSGYIISQQFPSDQKLGHFDVIVYDQLESPVLWYQGSSDVSAGGRRQAIPAEYVVAVIEVKSSLEPQTIKDGIGKLGQLSPLLEQIDDSNERYKKYLPANFCCALVFVELRQENANKKSILSNMINGLRQIPRGFYGAIVLRGEGLEEILTSNISFVIGETPIPEIPTNLLSPSATVSSQEPQADGLYTGVIILWSPIGWSSFLFDLIAIWNGTYRPGYTSSFHGFSFEDHEDAE